MMLALIGGYSLVQIAIFIVLLIVVVGIVLIVARTAGIAIPQWVWQIVGLVVLAIVAIVAIKFVAGL